MRRGPRDRLEAGSTYWADAGLPRCQALAEAIARGHAAFRQLDALQLLKHALGVATATRSTTQAFSLLYLWYDDAGEVIGRRHREEIENFAALVDASLGFRGVSYQALKRWKVPTPLPPDTCRAMRAYC